MSGPLYVGYWRVGWKLMVIGRLPGFEAHGYMDAYELKPGYWTSSSAWSAGSGLLVLGHGCGFLALYSWPWAWLPGPGFGSLALGLEPSARTLGTS